MHCGIGRFLRRIIDMHRIWTSLVPMGSESNSKIASKGPKCMESKQQIKELSLFIAQKRNR